jgi:hypothetical protein
LRRRSSKKWRNANDSVGRKFERCGCWSGAHDQDVIELNIKQTDDCGMTILIAEDDVVSKRVLS